MTPGGPGFDGWLMDGVSGFGWSDVAALLVAPDGRYLMQHRDPFPHLRVPDHWGLFGGRIEDGETPRQALFRELAEELEFTPRRADWFTESALAVPQIGQEPTRKTFFVVPVTFDEIAAMVLHEGAEKGLFTLPDLMAQPKVVPWDAYAVLLHARRDTALHVPTPGPAQANV